MIKHKEKLTICINCKWFVSEGESWANQFCSHPKQEKKECFDFVKGISGFGDKYNLSQEKRPHAVHVNEKGNCKTYEPLNDQ